MSRDLSHSWAGEAREATRPCGAAVARPFHGRDRGSEEREYASRLPDAVAPGNHRGPVSRAFPYRALGATAAGTSRVRPASAFTLIELLIVVAIVALLAGFLLPALAAARRTAHRAVCASNLRQLAIANDLYALDHVERYAPAAADTRRNLNRWHGTRTDITEPFHAEGGALTPYLDAAAPHTGRSVRACPAFLPTLRDLASRGRSGAAGGGGGFEQSAGGYGYNKAFVGSVRVAGRGADESSPRAWLLTDDRLGSPRHRFGLPSATLVFADTALAAGPGDAAIEYSFAEPRFWPDAPGYRADPSVHFRHAGSGRGPGEAIVAWLDGHISGERRTLTWSSGLYAGDADAAAIGWTGDRDDNSLYDYE